MGSLWGEPFSEVLIMTRALDGVDLVLWFDGESEELETLMIKPVN
jgi:hypothetical protein